MSPARRLFQGGCHCGANRYRLAWPGGQESLPARRCTCTFCTRFNGTWTSHPDAGLDMLENRDSPLTRYRFGTATADFLFCSRCGVTLAAVCEIGGRMRAVVNVNTLDGRDPIDFDCSDSDFEGESPVQRLDRRRERWIGRVRVQSVEDRRG